MSNRLPSALFPIDLFLAALMPAICLWAGSLHAQSVFENSFETWQNCGLPCDSHDADQCATGILDCSVPGVATCEEAESFSETCNGADDDCDGLTDFADGDLVAEACENQVGVCAGSTKGALECQGANGWAACGAATYSNFSLNYQIEETSCDGSDNDCDGISDGPDVASNAPLNTNQNGSCAGSVQTCMGGKGWLEDYSSIPGYGIPEFGCNGLDENCDGIDGQVSDACPPLQ